ncbi:Fur family transcriptional regulator [Caloramator sp. E03]|uniref:Fur family transcriptional regulator n=1 Tax=Caloramator sp. E03 TaxID=2576307 RepID=UPI00143E0BC9|nr:Fur family transcriptional regulator [Caloramator sp. E03]
MENKNRYNEILTKEGFKKTKHRTDILEILYNSDKPLSAEEIYLYLKQNDSSISLSTIYRNMDRLIERNLVIKNTLFNDNKARFEISRKNHKHHIICLKCNKMIEIDECPFKELENKIKNETGFEIETHKFEIYGYCENCKDNKK